LNRIIHTQGRIEAEQGIIARPQEAIARSYQYRDRYAQFYLMRGPSGVGKSTWIQKFILMHILFLWIKFDKKSLDL
jgi:hypothetical protein